LKVKQNLRLVYSGFLQKWLFLVLKKQNSQNKARKIYVPILKANVGIIFIRWFQLCKLTLVTFVMRLKKLLANNKNHRDRDIVTFSKPKKALLQERAKNKEKNTFLILNSFHNSNLLEVLQSSKIIESHCRYSKIIVNIVYSNICSQLFIMSLNYL
jgi:hypothetical protein